MTTLPSFTRTIDDAFVDTWYEIRADAVDNILDATVGWNVLDANGCFTPQVGSEIITRTISYGTTTAVDVAKGDVMVGGEPDLETMAIWYWKYCAVNIQRSMFDDQKNAGPSKIKSYVGKRLTSSRDGLEALFETNLWGTFKAVETGKIFQGLNDMVPSIANRTTGAYGGITRPTAYADAGNGVHEASTGNTWWGSKYLAGTPDMDVNLLDDMKLLYNSLHANQSAPNLIITTQAVFEVYETYALDISQIVKDTTTRLADLGFEALRFKGKPIIWASGMDDDAVLMLNTDWIEVVYDPELWFDMTDWKPIAAEFDRMAQIVCAANAITTQPRRHGRLEY